jgi:hypothetical protein
MRMPLFAAALAVAVTASLPVTSARALVYDVDRAIAAGGVTGTITTDGTTGMLGDANVLD